MFEFEALADSHKAAIAILIVGGGMLGRCCGVASRAMGVVETWSTPVPTVLALCLLFDFSLVGGLAFLVGFTIGWWRGRREALS